jgi:hypothetical protein
VTKATVTATADHQTKTYGQANPSLTITYTNFVNGEDASVLDVLPTAATTAADNSPVADYPITLTGGSDSNYDIILIDGTVSVTPATLTLTAPTLSRTYGAANPTLEISYSGFVNGEGVGALSVLPTIATIADTTSSVGAYAITVTGGNAGNYTLVPVNGTLTITPVALNVTAASVSRNYGEANPVFTGTLTGLLNSDPITATYDSDANELSPAGSYAIVPSLAGSPSVLANYDITSVNGTLTVLGGLSLSTNAGFYVIGTPAVLIDTNALLSDGNGIDFNGATLTVAIASNGAPADVLSIANGTNAGSVSVAGLTVSYNSAQIGAYSGGTTSSPLVFVFNANATSTALTALMHQLKFATTNMSTDSRVFQFTMAYGDNSVSATRAFVLDRPPVAHDIVVSVTEGLDFNMSFTQLLTNSTDADGDTMTVTGISSISAYGGTLETDTNSLTYYPPGGDLSGQDLFAYRVDDGRGGQGIGIVTLKFVRANELQLDASGMQDAGVELTMGGTPGQSYAIEASTDFVHWTVLSIETADSTGVIQILDAQAKNFPQKFYRAVLQH